MRWRAGAGVIGAAAMAVAALTACAGISSADSPPAGGEPGSARAEGTVGTPKVAPTTASLAGMVLGTFQRVGGPVLPNGGTPTVPLAGVVSFQRLGAGPALVSVGKSGKFSVLLPPGTYRVSGRTTSIEQQNPDGSTSDPPCSAPLTVRVLAGQTERITVTCPVP